MLFAYLIKGIPTLCHRIFSIIIIHQINLSFSRKFLVVENDENKDHHKTAKGHLSKENLQLVFKVIATALQTQ